MGDIPRGVPSAAGEGETAHCHPAPAPAPAQFDEGNHFYFSRAGFDYDLVRACGGAPEAAKNRQYGVEHGNAAVEATVYRQETDTGTRSRGLACGRGCR